MNLPISLTFAELSDHEVLAQIHDAVRGERLATARLIALLAELDTRRLYLGESCSSLFTYCTRVLHLSEHAAYNRIEAARAARRFPVILKRIESAELTLTAVRLLSPHLTDSNYLDVLERARHKSRSEVELLVATLCPQPDVRSTVRKLPSPPTLSIPLAVAEQTVNVDPPLSDALASVPKLPPHEEMKPLAPDRW